MGEHLGSASGVVLTLDTVIDLSGDVRVLEDEAPRLRVCGEESTGRFSDYLRFVF